MKALHDKGFSLSVRSCSITTQWPIPPRDNRVVIVAIDGELLVKIYREQASGTFLVAANRSYPIIELDESQQIIFWGVVTTAVHRISVSTVRASQW
ncbi:MAG: S24 family peptidase [Phormidesmis sp.]